jgi:hypothetical protein
MIVFNSVIISGSDQEGGIISGITSEEKCILPTPKKYIYLLIFHSYDIP